MTQKEKRKLFETRIAALLQTEDFLGVECLATEHTFDPNGRLAERKGIKIIRLDWETSEYKAIFIPLDNAQYNDVLNYMKELDEYL